MTGHSVRSALNVKRPGAVAAARGMAQEERAS